jgi:hypothetical protein
LLQFDMQATFTGQHRQRQGSQCEAGEAETTQYGHRDGGWRRLAAQTETTEAGKATGRGREPQ